MNNKNKKYSTKNYAKWNDEMVKKYHSQGTLFESKNPILRYIEKMRLKRIIKYADIKKNYKVLDLGCGEGFLLSIMPKAKEKIGLDISNEAIKKAKEILKNKPKIKCLKGDAHNTKFKSKYFDVITCSEMLEHVPYPKKVISEMHRILKDDGKVVISVPDERKIQSIMKILKITKLLGFLHAARKQEDYEWHIQKSDIGFIKRIIKGKFRISKRSKVPPIIKHRFVISLKKIQVEIPA